MHVQIEHCSTIITSALKVFYFGSPNQLFGDRDVFPRVGKKKVRHDVKLRNVTEWPEWFRSGCQVAMPLAKQYAPIKPLGDGGFGTVILCRKLDTGEKVAIKR